MCSLLSGVNRFGLCFTWGWFIKQTANGFNWISGLWAVVYLVNTLTSSTVTAAMSLGSLVLSALSGPETLWQWELLRGWVTERGATEEESEEVCLFAGVTTAHTPPLKKKNKHQRTPLWVTSLSQHWECNLSLTQSETVYKGSCKKESVIHNN